MNRVRIIRPACIRRFDDGLMFQPISSPHAPHQFAVRWVTRRRLHAEIRLPLPADRFTREILKVNRVVALVSPCKLCVRAVNFANRHRRRMLTPDRRAAPLATPPRQLYRTCLAAEMSAASGNRPPISRRPDREDHCPDTTILALEASDHPT